MEEKDREAKRARTMRTDYARDLDAVTAWIQRAELNVKDSCAEPQVLRDHLQQIQVEIGPTEDRLERLAKNARAICDNSRDDEEKARITATVNTLTEQLQQVRTWLQDKKQQVGDSLDAWSRFLALHQAVLTWAAEQNTFLAVPMQLTSLTQARQRLHDYSAAVRSCKQAGKNLSDMARELEQIGQVTSVGDLPDKLQYAEELKVKVEAQLLETNSLLQETSEEWERCEKKMKEVRAWLDNSQQSLESPQGRKRPLRDQLAQRDKMLATASTQKTKIALSVEKLQIHFRSGIGGDSKVTDAAKELIVDLDKLISTVKEQVASLEGCIAQLDQYQQEIQHLRGQIVQVESELRTVLSPNYSPHDRDRAVQEQNHVSSFHRVPIYLFNGRKVLKVYS